MKGKLPITVAILLGGESKRFGSSKAFLDWKGRSLAAHLAETSVPLAAEVLLVGKSEEQIPPDTKALARLVIDAPGFPGPLAGLAAALSNASNPWIFLTGVDMPYLNGKTLEEFWKLREKSVLLGAVVPHVDGKWQPLCALWNKYALKLLEGAPWRSFQYFLNESGLKVLKVEESALRSWDPELLCLKGFNDEESLNELKDNPDVP